jgi:Tfp pilus assembly protein PilW
MECNATFTKSRRGQAALSTVEFLVAIGAGMLVLLGLSQLTAFTGRSFAALRNYADLDKKSRNALDQMTSKIRQADELIDYATNRLVFSSQVTNRLSYVYDSRAKTLTETFSGATHTLLTECDVLKFDIYQRNTVGGTYDQFPATITNSAVKLVQVSWTCSRSLLGGRINTESVQSAKIVIRNQ